MRVLPAVEQVLKSWQQETVVSLIAVNRLVQFRVEAEVVSELKNDHVQELFGMLGVVIVGSHSDC